MNDRKIYDWQVDGDAQAEWLREDQLAGCRGIMFALGIYVAAAFVFLVVIAFVWALS